MTLGGVPSSIMARCTGKTDVHNLEPEDIRSITVATAKAAGVPLSGVSRDNQLHLDPSG